MGIAGIDIKQTLIRGGLTLAAVLCLGRAETARAGVVEANGGTDAYNIQQELNKTGRVTLKKGGTYRLYDSLVLGSNMSIEAEGATVICEKPIAFNIPEKTDYKAAVNISINGGTWKSEAD